MSLFKKEVKAIIAGQDVRDPRAALLAIERLCDAKISGPKKPEKLLRITVTEGSLPGTVAVDIAHNECEFDILVSLAAVRKAVTSFIEARVEKANV